MLALEFSNGDIGDAEFSMIFDHRRPDGSYYTTAIKEVGKKKFKKSSIIAVTNSGSEDFDFVAYITSPDRGSWLNYSSVLDTNTYTHWGIGYYANSDNSCRCWVLIPTDK